jgi:hypothetical protein
MVVFGMLTLAFDLLAIANGFHWGESAILWALIRLCVALSFVICMALLILGYLYEFIQWLRKRGAA